MAVVVSATLLVLIGAVQAGATTPTTGQIAWITNLTAAASQPALGRTLIYTGTASGRIAALR